MTNKNKRREEEGEAVLQASSFVNQEEASDSRNSDRPVLDSFDDFSNLICRPIRTGYQFLPVYYSGLPHAGAMDDYENYDFVKM